MDMKKKIMPQRVLLDYESVMPDRSKDIPIVINSSVPFLQRQVSSLSFG
jgi:hypothetical protein